jgi:hypothetical protein
MGWIVGYSWTNQTVVFGIVERYEPPKQYTGTWAPLYVYYFAFVKRRSG